MTGARCPRCGLVAPGAGLALCPRCLLTGGAAAGIDDHEAGAGGGGGAPSLPGLTLGEEIGRGGMGRVFRARHLRLDREVAVKLLSPELAADPLFDERFAREARLLGRLSHPHIVAVHDFGVTGGGQSYLVMELVPGGTLAERLPLPPLEAVRVALELLDGLAYAHGKGLVHRDIKPANVLFDERGGAKLADFGIARLAFADPAVGASGGRADGDALTRPSMVAGTPGYVAPEARLGAPPDPRMDVFGVGVLLHRMITGKLPAFDLPQGERPGEGSGRGLGEGLGEGPGEGPGEGRVMPAALGAVVRRATAFDPRDRPAGAAELAALLELAIAGVPDARVDRRAAGAAFSAAPTLSAGAAVGAASAAAEVVAGAAAFPAETLPPDERSWQRSVALVMAAATAVAIYALLVSVTPRVLEPGDELPLVRFGAERRPDGRLYTRARFETLPVLATAGAFAVAFAAYGLLRRHWRRAGLDLPAPHRPLASTRPLLRLALILNAIFLARTGLDRAGLGRSVTAYVPVLAGVLELVMVYRFWRAVLEARRTARPLSREPLLWLALALALVPPAVSLVRTLAGQEI